MTGLAGALQGGGRACPGCGMAMQRGAFERRVGGTAEIEICIDCRAIWFDAYESAQLAARGILGLFRIVDAARERPARPLDGTLHCPACHDPLVLTHDLEHTTRFTYYRCDAGHGRFTPFVQFLREKEFVRSLTPAEVERLRVTVREVRCTACGGAIDLGRDAACPYCGSPIALLDADAMQRTLARLEEEARQAPRQPDSPVPGDSR